MLEAMFVWLLVAFHFFLMLENRDNRALIYFADRCSQILHSLPDWDPVAHFIPKAQGLPQKCTSYNGCQCRTLSTCVHTARSEWVGRYVQLICSPMMGHEMPTDMQLTAWFYNTISPKMSAV